LNINTDWLWIVLAVLAACVVVALVGLLAMVQRIRRLNIPPDADYFTTLRYVPLGLVILLDLLDAGLDILAAPISWIILDRMGLRGLRNKAAVEALVPFTQVIPTFTLSWIAARTLDLGEQPWQHYDRGLERRLPR
jgi:hypothetical protein